MNAVQCSTDYTISAKQLDELDVSSLLGYTPGSVVLVSNQGSTASMTTFINPNATLACDFNNDKKVDAADLALLTAGFGVTGSATHAQGDATRDGNVDGADLIFWQQQLGLSNAAGALAAPEPGSFGMVLSGCAALGVARRRRGH